MTNSRKTNNTTGHNMHRHTLIFWSNANSSWIGLLLLVFTRRNGSSCDLHLFGYGNSLVVNQNDMGIGLCFPLCSFVQNKLTCYTINNNGSYCVCFTAREYVTGDNDCQLDDAIVQIMEVFMADHKNCSMHHLFHHNLGYAYRIVLSYYCWIKMIMPW